MWPRASPVGFGYYRYTGAGCILTPELRAIKAELGRKGGLIGGKVSKGGGKGGKVNELGVVAEAIAEDEGRRASSIRDDSRRILKSRRAVPSANTPRLSISERSRNKAIS